MSAVYKSPQFLWAIAAFDLGMLIANAVAAAQPGTTTHTLLAIAVMVIASISLGATIPAAVRATTKELAE